MKDGLTLLKEAAQVWAKTQLVHEEPSWDGNPVSRYLVELVAAAPDCHDGLVSLLSSPNQLVVAHAIQALELMRSPVLAELPDELCDRRQKVTFQCGSFRNSMDLGGYARQVRKRARHDGVAGCEVWNMERSLGTFTGELANHPEGFGGLFDRMGYLVLLPLLQFPYPGVAERLVTALTSSGVPETLARAVSLRELVGFALHQATPYWASRAVVWLEQGFPFDRQLAEAVDHHVAGKHWSQQERHRAFRLVRQWERQQGAS